MALTTEQERHLAALLERSGVADDLAREADAARVAEEAALRTELARNEARLSARMPKLQAAVDQADTQELAARRAAEAALAARSKAFAAREQLHDEYWAARNRIEPQLRRVADPRLGALALEIRSLAENAPSAGLQQEDRSRRARETLALIEDVGRLIVSPDLSPDAVPAELDRIRNAARSIWTRVAE